MEDSGSPYHVDELVKCTDLLLGVSGTSVCAGVAYCSYLSIIWRLVAAMSVV
ncbi:hypothetical protein HanPI659440_Chr16g0629191 [Helianthus annuus]|nr:hypothetical protein HanPI659440_Chr16g0629191 [Helianthus annuus]